MRGAPLLLVVLALRLDALPLLLVAQLRRALTILLVSLLLRAARLIIARRGRRRDEIRLPGLGRREHARAARGGVASEDDARVHRPLADGGRTIGWRRLMRRRNAVDPDAAHPRRRTMALGYAGG
jgi:hypothetical protein